MKNKTKELILKANEMKAQELRIGNIVSHGDYSSETFEVLSIEFTDETYIINTKGGKNGTWGNPIDMITKVPLTKEWLLKFGFWHDEETKLYHWGAAGEIRVNIETLEFYSYGNWHIAMVQYVHELQNLCFEVEKAEDLKLEKIYYDFPNVLENNILRAKIIQEYAAFCVKCDREKLSLITFNDYCKL